MIDEQEHISGYTINASLRNMHLLNFVWQFCTFWTWKSQENINDVPVVLVVSKRFHSKKINFRQVTGHGTAHSDDR